MGVLYDSLPNATPDVAQTLDIGWSGNLQQTGGKEQIIRYGVDRRRRVTELGESSIFFVVFSYDVLLPAQKETILDLYLNQVNQFEKSFIWRGYEGTNKTDYNDYVVYFDSKITVGIGQVMDSIGNVFLSIKGKLSA